jgi:hypothetical protein
MVGIEIANDFHDGVNPRKVKKVCERTSKCWSDRICLAAVGTTALAFLANQSRRSGGI